MPFGFGGGLSVDRDHSTGRSFGGSSLGRGLGVDRSVGGRSDRGGDSFFERQRRRSGGEGADLSGFQAAPNPEIGPATPQRVEQARAIERVHGSAIAAFMRGNLETGLDLTARNVGRTLGVTEELAVDEAGLHGTRGRLQPLSLLSALPFGMGLNAAVVAGRMIGPATGAQVGLDALGQTRALQALGAQLPAIDLGFRPSRQRVRGAQGRRAAGRELNAADALALDYADRRQASIDAAASQRAQRSERKPELVRSIPARPAPAPSGEQATTLPRGFGRLAGNDPNTDLDLLSTSRDAAVAAGLASPGASVRTSTRRPLARPRGLI